MAQQQKTSWQYKLRCGDCLEVMHGMPTDSVDLVMTSPPYEDRRAYAELEFQLTGADYLAWLIPRIEQMVRVSRGIVAIVICDRTVDFEWIPTVPFLICSLANLGIRQRRPPLYVREGISGSGGKDWFKNKYETIICCTKVKGELPWHDNTACGHPPKCKPGGPNSHRTKSGKRANTKGKAYKPPKLSNPGNLIVCGADTHLGAGNSGEAPYPVKVPSFFIRSLCPPGGIVFDPFCGTGTTLVAALEAGRRGVGVDARPSQIEISQKRLSGMKRSFGF